MHLLNTITAFLLVALSATTRAEVIEIQWDSAGRFERNLTVPPGKLAELCGRIGRDTKVTWSFKSDQPLNFNIHYHEGETVTYPVKQTGSTAADGVLDVGQPQEYCWMWSNKGAVPAPVKVSLKQPGTP